MFNVLYRQTGRLLKKGIATRTLKRFFLSPSYSCSEAWDKRLKSPVFEKLDVEELYSELDKTFQIGHKVSLLDIDLFVNSLKDETHLEILEDVLFKLRLNPETSAVLESTNHAAVRWYLANQQKSNLLNILSERLSFGVFLDFYLSNLLMDSFLKENDVLSAVKIAVLQMLQEECSHPITTPLGLHSCYKYLNSSETWAPPKPEEEVDEEDQIRVRVLFARNPYFDDHFDIEVPNHLVGKTLVLFGKELGGPVGVSSQIVGNSLYEKHNNNIDLLENILSKKIKVHKEALTKAKEYTLTKPKQPEGTEGKTDEKTTLENEEEAQTKGKVIKLLEDIEKLNISIDEPLESATGELVKKAVEEQGPKDIQNQLELYKKWEDIRQKLIDFEVEESRKNSAMAEIEKLKEELKKEEERLFFFDKEREINVVAEVHEEERKNVRFWVNKKSKHQTGDDYVPPDTYIPPSNVRKNS